MPLLRGRDRGSRNRYQRIVTEWSVGVLGAFCVRVTTRDSIERLLLVGHAVARRLVIASITAGVTIRSASSRTARRLVAHSRVVRSA